MKIKNVLYIGILLVLLSVILSAISWNVQFKKVSENSSRLWMEYSMDIVRTEKPTPPESARFYAAVATSYYECLHDGREKANGCTQEIINFIYPEKKASTTEFLGKNNLLAIDSSESEIIKKIKKRYTEDGEKKFEKKFLGEEYWVGNNPLSPETSNWDNWNLQNFEANVSAPPKYQSAEFKSKINEVKVAAANRTLEQVALINFWGGIPGTEAPAGIWQNRFFNETKNLNLSDEEYAYVQMILAQALADSFIECWKVKYTYYTKRPSMIDQSINLAMNNPNFPSYTSGHSTISATAATVLGEFFPNKKDIFLQDAMNAKNSRLWAGIHFSHDNEEGFKLGEKIGQFYIENIIKNK